VTYHSTRTVGAAIRAVRDQFRAAEIETADLDARLLAEAATGLDALALVLRDEEVLPDPLRDELSGLAERRLLGEPVARIVGEKEFYGLAFSLNEATLVPRPETELLVDMGVHLLHGREEPRILDLGTGTGCVAIAILSQVPAARAVAVDLSGEALAAASHNALRHGVADRLVLREGSWYEPLEAGERFDLIVSNPPYVESFVIPSLQPEVREHDPQLALDGGPDGLAAYRAIIEGAAGRLTPRGSIILEIGSSQSAAVGEILAGAGFSGVETEKDLAGLDRALSANHL
jgi:release factor glutamine methyltransferase